MTAEFDRHARGYQAALARSVASFGEEIAYFAAYKAKDARRLALSRTLPKRILDFGTGIGGMIPHLAEAFPGCALHGADVSAASLEVARERFAELAAFTTVDGSVLPFPDQSFDVITAACVFHHIDAPLRMPVLSELRRVLAPRGVLVIHEHNPWNPLTRRAVAQCEFDENADLISLPRMRRLMRDAGLSILRWEFRLFFPAALAALRAAEPLLVRMPAGAQYLVAATR